MIYKNVELYNVEEVQPTADNSGAILYRFPLDVIDTLKQRASWISRSNTGCEIRFFSTASVLWVTMEALVNDAHLTVFCGDFVYQKIILKAGSKTTFQLECNQLFENVSEKVFQSEDIRYPKDLWRIYINNESSHCIFYDVQGLDGIVRPPRPDESPSLKWLAYGSSITHGCWTDDTANSHIQYAARLLGTDVLCKAMSGSCWCEKEMANYIAGAEWDFAVLELGTNMYAFKTKEFRKRVQYLIDTVHEMKPDKKVFIVSLFPTRDTFSNNTDRELKYNDYTEILKELCLSAHSDNLIFIEGKEILDSYSYFCYDMCHPSEYGHVRMGENLANILKKYL